MHLFCVVLDQNIELVILKQQFGGFSRESGIRWLKNEQVNVCFFVFVFFFLFFFFFVFSLLNPFDHILA